MLDLHLVNKHFASIASLLKSNLYLSVTQLPAYEIDHPLYQLIQHHTGLVVLSLADKFTQVVDNIPGAVCLRGSTFENIHKPLRRRWHLPRLLQCRTTVTD